MRSMECMPKMIDEGFGMYAQNEGMYAQNEGWRLECMPKMRDEEC